MASKWVEVPLEQLKAQTKSAFAMGPFGSKIKAENFTTVGVPVIKGGNLNATYLDESDFDFLTQEKADELESAKARRLDIVITHRGTLGQVGLIPEDSKYEEYVVSQSQLKMSFDIKRVDPYFVYYFLKSPLGQSRLLSNVSQVGVPAIAQALTSVRAIEIPIPEDRSEQTHISSVLRSLDDKIDLNRRINQTLAAMTQAIFKSWFVDFDPVKAKIAAIEQGQDPLRAAMRAISGKTDAELDQMPREHHDQFAATAALFPDAMEESELGEIPKGWKAGTLAEICHLNPESWSAKTLPNTVSYVDLANTKSGEISELQVVSEKDIPSRARRILRSGDTIIGTVRPGNRSFALVGKENLTGSTGFAVLRPIAQEWLEFVYLVATSRSNIDRLTHLADGGAYPAVRPEVVVQGNIVIPDRMLAQGFHQYVQPFWVNILANRESTETLAELRDVLLPELLSGNIYIQHEEDR